MPVLDKLNKTHKEVAVSEMKLHLRCGLVDWILDCFVPVDLTFPGSTITAQVILAGDFVKSHRIHHPCCMKSSFADWEVDLLCWLYS